MHTAVVVIIVLIKITFGKVIIMNKTFFSLVAVALTLAVSPALADHHGDKKGGKFLKLDTDGNGIVSKTEFLSGAEGRFSKMDANGDGEITKEEAQAAKEKAHERLKERREKKAAE